MKHLIFAAVFLAITITAQAQIYTWVDKNGTTHFSDKLQSNKAREINVEASEVTYHDPLNKQRTAQPRTITTQKAHIKKYQAPTQRKVITEKDYKISGSVGKLGNDMIDVSGRVGNGPVCKDMKIVAFARNENGRSATVTERTKLTTSHGSTLFNGKVRVPGSAKDRSFWEIEKVTVRCYD